MNRDFKIYSLFLCSALLGLLSSFVFSLFSLYSLAQMDGSDFTAALSDFASSMQRMLSSTQQLLQMGQPPSGASAPSSFNPLGVSCHPSPPLDKTQVLGSNMALSPNQPTVHQLTPLSVAPAGASSQQGALENLKISASPQFDRSHVTVLQQSIVLKDMSTSSQGPTAQIATNRGKQDGFLRRYQPFRRSGTHLNPKTFFCYRCGDRGHRASSCRNALVCFTCGRLGHRAANCQSIPPLPPQLQTVVRPQMADPIPAPLIRVFPNCKNQKLQETLLNCLIFYDSYRLGASYVKSHLLGFFMILLSLGLLRLCQVGSCWLNRRIWLGVRKLKRKVRFGWVM